MSGKNKGAQSALSGQKGSRGDLAKALPSVVEDPGLGCRPPGSEWRQGLTLKLSCVSASPRPADLCQECRGQALGRGPCQRHPQRCSWGESLGRRMEGSCGKADPGLSGAEGGSSRLRWWWIFHPWRCYSLSLLTVKTYHSCSNQDSTDTLREASMFCLIYHVSLKNDYYSQFSCHWSKDHEAILSRNMVHFPDWKEIITTYKIDNQQGPTV